MLGGGARKFCGSPGRGQSVVKKLAVDPEPRGTGGRGQILTRLGGGGARGRDQKIGRANWRRGQGAAGEPGAGPV